uniref:Protein kinase domain-containing protein n=1 Tax=Setaria digitata TaxID=48799 RepID=A0A915PXE2_9BILA
MQVGSTGSGQMRRCCSLPHLFTAMVLEECRAEVNSHDQSSVHGRLRDAKQEYGGRYSLNKTKPCRKFYDEGVQDRVRMRNSSVRSQGERFSRYESYTVCDEVYQCLLPEPDQPLVDSMIQPPALISTTKMRCELGRSAISRDQYHCSLYHLLRVSVMAKLNRLCEKPTLGSVRKSSQQVLLINRRNERFKWSDVLWLQLQAAVAGRQMKSATDQIKSIREQDKYLIAEREKRKVILEEILNFCLNSGSEATLPSPLPSTMVISSQKSLKAELKVVKNILERYEDFVALYPNINNMERSTNVNELVKTRIQILYAWYNITIDLYARIREVGVILGVYKGNTSNRRISLSPSVVSRDNDVSYFNFALFKSSESCHLPSPQNLLSIPHSSMITSNDFLVLLEQSHNIYTAFVSRSLRRKGMRKVLQRLDSVCFTTVKKAITMLEKLPITYAEVVESGSRQQSVDYATKQKRDLPHGLTSHQEFSAMKLPSFQNLFLFLVRVPLDLVHEWLKMRGSGQLPFDLLTLQTVMEDCHDCIEAAIAVKHQFVSLVQLAGVDNKVLLGCLMPFEDELAEVFKSYLTCIRDWVHGEVSTEGVGAEWTERVIQNLTSQWTVARRFAVNVISGESETVHRFCMIASDLMRKMVNDYLPEKEDLMEECRSTFESAPLDGLQECDDSSLRRHFKSLVCQMKDRSLRSLSFARMLLMDIEICALYNLKSTEIHSYLSQLYISHHSLVIISSDLTNVNNNYVLFCDENASKNVDFLRILLNITCSRYHAELPKAAADCNGYLLIISLQTCFADFSGEMWNGTRLTVDIDADAELSLRYLQLSNDACLVAVSAPALIKMKELFARNMTVGHDFMFDILEEQASCHDIVIESAKQLRKLAYGTCQMLFDEFAGKMVDDVLDGHELSSLDANELESVRATLIQAYNLAFEYHREFYRILSRQDRRSFAWQTVCWAKDWLHFALEFVNPGDGTVPLWAIQSFQFLILAACPELTVTLTEKEFQTLVKIVDACVAHIVGSSIPDSGLVNGTFFDHEVEEGNSLGFTESKPYSTADATARSQRIRGLLNSIDEKRNKHLEADNKIGRVTEGGRRALTLSTYFNPKKRAPFEWQRLEKKIGSGKFGTVYVVMNLTENCLMAMKQIRIERNERALLSLVDEVENLSLLDHPNLVKYYAVEVHREELFIFMEYCPEGTLEEVCREGLLDMRCVRRYTHFLLKGVEYIHMKLIVHRDIKPANIFLGKRDVLKLGDFGSSVRLKNGTTACGEVAEWVGTPAYMAPEVQTLGGRTEVNGREELVGYGRAADIWSVGCVVLEMCTGKPPWHECEQVLQVVFRVGSGMKPTIPQSVQANLTCYSFLDRCFQIEPGKRATAEQLRKDPFADININLFICKAIFVGRIVIGRMYQCLPRCSTSNTLLRIFRTCNLRRCYSPMFAETTSSEISEPRSNEVQKRKDPSMLEEVDVKNLPRAERRHVEEFLKMSETRAVAMQKLSYKNLATFLVLFGLAVGVYSYTYTGLKQETFLEEIDEELAAELAEKQKEN